jgi:Uma2 family endonuclease
VVRGELRDYRDRHPGPQDVALVVEVADTSLRQDRGPKKRVYARAGIPIYWIVDLKAEVIEVHVTPTSAGKRPDYRESRTYGAAEEVPVLLDGVEVGRIPVREILP